MLGLIRTSCFFVSRTIKQELLSETGGYSDRHGHGRKGMGGEPEGPLCWPWKYRGR